MVLSKFSEALKLKKTQKRIEQLNRILNSRASPIQKKRAQRNLDKINSEVAF